MTLHPQSQTFVDMIAEQNRPQWQDLPVEQSRQIFESFDPFFGVGPELIEVQDVTLDGINARIYRDTTETAPAAMLFHGGGWVLGNLNTHDSMCRRIAKHSRCVVVSVDYEPAPENPFPGPLDQCYRATEAVAAQASRLKIDASKIAVVGDSAGGNLAAAVCLKSRDESGPTIALQVLIYPVIEPNFETTSYHYFADGFGLTRANMQWFWEQYLGTQTKTHLAIPSIAESLSGLPQAHIITAQYDVLREEGESYAAQLRAAGVPVTHQRYEGMLHAFVHFADLFDVGTKATKDIAKIIQSRLA